MTGTIRSILFTSAIILSLATLGMSGGSPGTFSKYVDEKGAISLPTDLPSGWVHLGTWVLTSKAQTIVGGPGPGLHGVYTRPESLEAFQKTGKWPDGTALVMEVRSLKWDDLPTGHVISGGDSIEWFVMIRDTNGRFPGNPNWGDGWGWARFTAADQAKNASVDYKNDCMSCHDLAKDTEWVFTGGFPALDRP